MRSVPTFTAIGLALGFAATASQAVSFGRVTNATELGQPLNFSAAIHLEPDEPLPRECVSAEVQSGDNKIQPQQVRATLEGAAGSTDRSVRVTTSAMMDEPVVTVSVTLGCTAKTTRRFIAFVDPPLIDAPRTAQTEPAPVPQRVDSQVAPIVAIVQGSEPPRVGSPRNDRAPDRLRSGGGPVPSAFDSATAAARAQPPPPVKPRRVAPNPRPPVPSRAATPGSRLQLETAPPALALAASAAASAVPPVALAAPVTAASSAPAVAAAVPAEDQLRVQALEVAVAKLRSDSAATKASQAALLARLDQAESERYANPVVYTLAWLSALLAVALAAFWWRQSRGRQPTQWWTGPTAPPTPSNVRLAQPVVSAPQPLESPVTAADAFDVSTIIEEDPVPATQTSYSTRPAPFVNSRLAPITLSPEPPRELSVEELIDLEQQAEFFIVLGQDEAAIELLMSHVRSDGGISPLPYLKLLEIYRRRGEEDAYQRIRERFNRRFNSYAPDWAADLQQGRSLVDYPDTIVRLQALWSSPVRVMETLDASLFRRNRTDETFDLPAYRELLFLYSVARDLAEHAGVLPATSVDLFLPLDDPGGEPISRLTATTESGGLDFRSSDMMTLPLDLDVTFAPAKGQGDTNRAAARQRPEGPHAALDSNFIDFDLDQLAPAPELKAERKG